MFYECNGCNAPFSIYFFSLDRAAMSFLIWRSPNPRRPRSLCIICVCVLPCPIRLFTSAIRSVFTFRLPCLLCRAFNSNGEILASGTCPGLSMSHETELPDQVPCTFSKSVDVLLWIGACCVCFCFVPYLIVLNPLVGNPFRFASG